MTSPASPPLPPPPPSSSSSLLPPLGPRLQRLLIVIAWMLILAGGASALVFTWPLLSRILNILLPFLVAFVFAYVFDPIVTFVQKRLHLSRVVGMIVLYLFLLLVGVGFFALLIPALYKQSANVVRHVRREVPARVGSYLESRGIPPDQVMTMASDWLTSHGLSFEEIALRAAKSSDVRNAARQAATGGMSLLARGFSGLFNLIESIFSGIGFAILAFIINFYLLLDFHRLRGAVVPLIPDRWRERSLDVGRKLDRAVGGFLRGQIIDCAIVGVLTTIGLALLGLREYAILLGFITGAANFIPYLGPILGGAPAVLLVLMSDSYAWPQEKLSTAVLVVAVFAIVQTIDGFILQPKIVGKSAQLHPLAVTLALVVGAQFGIMGMIVAVPAACIIRVLWKEFYWDARVRAIEQAAPKSPSAKDAPQ